LPAGVRGSSAPLRKPVGDCDKSRNREILRALARVDAEFGEIRREISPERLFLRVFRRIENALATIPEKPASFKASSSAKGAVRGARRGVNFGWRPE